MDQNFHPKGAHLDVEHCAALRMVYVVPDTEAAAVLSHDDVALRNPLDVTGIVEDCCLGLGVYIEQVKLKWKESREERVC